MEFYNSYEDKRCCTAYARIEFPGTYFLAFRDLPNIISGYVNGNKALDFGCGAGRSTRFLKQLGFDTIGVDISKTMIRNATTADPCGDYRLVEDNARYPFAHASFDLVLSAFTFDNIPTLDRKIAIFTRIRNLVADNGIVINIVSAPEIYTHEWASFSTTDFPGNRNAASGDPVKIIITDSADNRPVVDILCSDEDYRKIFEHAGLKPVGIFKPLAHGQEPYRWINETVIAPWTIYVLKPSRSSSSQGYIS